jgi:hypothetical protein
MESVLKYNSAISANSKGFWRLAKEYWCQDLLDSESDALVASEAT